VHRSGAQVGSGALTELPAAGASSTDPTHLEAWARLHETIKALPSELRDVFDLLWYQGMVQREAAGVLGISEATLKRRWHDARLAVGPAALALLERSPR
jgi:DNA-directed RNA polymerase specialized sigma24 family protein